MTRYHAGLMRTVHVGQAQAAVRHTASIALELKTTYSANLAPRLHQ